MTDIWGNFTNGSVEYAVQAFQAVDPWFYPIIMVAIIGYIYTAMNSVTAAVIGIIITLGIFGATTSIFEAEGIAQMTQFLYVVTIIGISMLLLSLVTYKNRS